ncbi:ATP-binding cassette domain-containing protein [Bifidobacterium sp.]|jgi:simple sugar transport system ATP-binding protein|uniref:ATP-binding cassette domain-containing protein n=1 Tax=Bifidobacterium sp. TaxID=41200 RepID=UPI0025BA3C5B|nr:ATP-binding cassette domain-containing protein [Bifidobacterium sp.]MCH4160145.1 ATP-binding cassette domain-containing protein [Bifidobacterium sp.]MCH4174385.1 ATP-binding cassette domain-containing protein [Bifidobacterium sp.]MCI1635794.1 ATP-binding cassette domain-containing protein [Bifidobacterium sp.]
MTAKEHHPLLETIDVSLRFGFTEALKNVNLTINRREVLAVVGDNGAGKSTLVKTLAGFYQPNAGQLLWKSEAVSISSIREANELGIASVFQDPEFCENLDVASNLFLGKEKRSTFRRRDDEGMYKEAKAVLRTLSSVIRIGQPIASLSKGQRQTVSIARTLLSNPELILLDEPTASLSVMQTAEVLSYIKRLRSENHSVLMICHDLPDVFAVADRIIVMRQGRINGVHYTKETSYEQIIAEIAGVNGSGQPFNDERQTQIAVNGMIAQHQLIDRSMKHHPFATL